MLNVGHANPGDTDTLLALRANHEPIRVKLHTFHVPHFPVHHACSAHTIGDIHASSVGGTHVSACTIADYFVGISPLAVF